MTVHDFPLEPATVWGQFDRDTPPALEIEPGDTVVFHTLDASWGQVGRDHLGETGPWIEHDATRGDGHALCGPVAVRGARPGDLLEVRVGEIVPGSWGWTWTGPRPWLKHFNMGLERDGPLNWSIDAAAGIATDRNDLGLSLPLRPFMGVLGNAPAEPGPHSTIPPRRVGGNLDCRDLVEGATLWLPIEVEGALFSVGDGHARQGDGEVGQTAMECPMERVELTFELRDGADWPAPRARTREGYLTLGLGETLDEAAEMALGGMLDHLCRELRIERPEAMALASLVVDLRVTQVVNRTVGAHAVLPHGLLR